MFGSNIHGDFLTQLERIHKLGGNLIQCFISNPAGKKTLKLTDEDIQTMKTRLNEYKMSMIIHAPYVLNFAREFKLESWWIKTLQRELEYASKIGAKGSVIHFGKYLHLDKHVAITNMVSSLKYIIEHMPKDVVIYLETSCGQGSELGYTIEEFAEIYNQFTTTEKTNIVVCIDTCHIFVAGYDIRNIDGIKKYLDSRSRRYC
jgi:deoxyribonuclease-4